MPAEVKILSTRNYGLFSFHRKNRRLDFKKVKRLAESMERNNLLHLFPIVVDKKMVILDGQHRYQAAKDISAEIFYIISETGYGIDDVAKSNNFQSHWKVDDFVLYYAASDRDQYKRLQHLSIKYLVAPGVVAAIEGRYSGYNAIKTGEFKFTNYDEVVAALELARLIQKKHNFTHWKRREFLKAIKHIQQINHFDPKKFINSIDSNPKMLIKCHTAEDYINLFEEIYNKVNKTSLRFL